MPRRRSLHTGMLIRRKGWAIAGVLTLAAVLLLDVAYYSFRGDPSHMIYEVEVNPSAEVEYQVTLPTVVDGAAEIAPMRSMTASGRVDVTRVETHFGLALEARASGIVTLRMECLSCWGDLSLEGRARVRSNATERFALAIRLFFFRTTGDGASNAFGQKIGGGCWDALDAERSIPSNTNWTVLDTVGGDGYCWDYFGPDPCLGLVVSIPCSVAGLIFLAAGLGVGRRPPP